MVLCNVSQQRECLLKILLQRIDRIRVLSNQDDFDQTIKSSRKAFDEWSNYTPLRRSRIIAKFKENIEKNIDELAKVVSSEHGKTIDDAKGSVIRGLEVVEFAIGIPHLLKGEFSQNVGTNIDFGLSDSL